MRSRGPLVTDEPTEFRRWRRIVSNVLPEVPNPDRAFFELWDHFGHPEAWRCFPDVEPALRFLSARQIPIRIASNFDARLRAVVQVSPELACCATPLVVSSEVGFRKPHAAFYQAACASLGLPPDRVLCVGDDLENDVLGAAGPGLRGLSARPPRPAAGPERVARLGAGPDRRMGQVRVGARFRRHELVRTRPRPGRYDTRLAGVGDLDYHPAPTIHL